MQRSILSLILAITLTLLQSANAQSDIFNSDIIELSLMFPDDSWHDTLAARKPRNDKTPVLATLQIGGKTYKDIQVRYKGNSSFHGTLKKGGKKLPFKIKAPKGTYFDGGYDELRLSNNFRDPSAIRELLGYEIAATYLPVPRIKPAVLTINGEYIGVYTLTEGISDRLLKETYCSDEGVLVKCDPQFSLLQPFDCITGEYSNLKYLGENLACYKPLYDISDGKEANTIKNLTRYLAESNNPDAYINVQEALWMHALNNVLVNLDSYLGIFCHNYFIYLDHNETYHPMIWDLNLAFGGFATLDQQVNPDLYELSPIAHEKYLKGRRPLIESLTTDRVNLLTYFYMINTIVSDWFLNDRYKERAVALQSLIRSYQEKEPTPEFPIEDFDRSLNETIERDHNRTIPGVVQLMERRKEYLSDHPLLKRHSPEVTNWSVESFADGVAVTVNTASEITEAYMYYQGESCGKWLKTPMIKQSNVSWQSPVLTVHQFYFLVATEKGVSLSPANAPRAVYRVSDESLN